jgi:hypothetical protein
MTNSGFGDSATVTVPSVVLDTAHVAYVTVPGPLPAGQMQATRAVVDDVGELAEAQADERAARKAARRAKRAKQAQAAALTHATNTPPAPARVGRGSAAQAGGKKPPSGHYYTQALATEILRLVEQAVPVADYEVFAGGPRSPGIGSRLGVPAHIIQHWLRNDGSTKEPESKPEGKFIVGGMEFAQAFARAREVAADHIADRMLAIADHALQNPGSANAARVAADILRWQAVVRYRTRYGDGDEAKRPTPQVLISIGSHQPQPPRLVGEGSTDAQIGHSQPQPGRIIPAKSGTTPPRPTDAGSVARGGIVIEARMTPPDPAGQPGQAGSTGGAGA